MITLLILLGSVSILPMAVILRGFVCCKLWLWFICPIFSIAPITIPQAIGLAVIAALFHPARSNSDKKPSWQELVAGFLGPVVSLGIGWMVHLFL